MHISCRLSLLFNLVKALSEASAVPDAGTAVRWGQLCAGARAAAQPSAAQPHGQLPFSRVSEHWLLFPLIKCL